MFFKKFYPVCVEVYSLVTKYFFGNDPQPLCQVDRAVPFPSTPRFPSMTLWERRKRKAEDGFKKPEEDRG
jgi:hypothetical protein